jgi:hypothetical protein
MINFSLAWFSYVVVGVRCLRRVVQAAKAANPEVLVLVDNCYGEFTDTREPCAVCPIGLTFRSTAIQRRLGCLFTFLLKRERSKLSSYSG